jgi:UDP-glucose 4-epimerase
MTASPSLDRRRALVTGASGFVGSRLSQRLLEAGAIVHGASRSEQTAGDIHWRTVDISDTEAARALVADVKPDLIFHLASHVSGSRDLSAIVPTVRANFLTSVNLLLAAAELGCSRFLLAGSLEEPDAEESTPVSPYAAAKFASGAYARMFHRLYGVPVVLLRIFMVYGPGQRDETKLVPYVITSLLRGESPGLSNGTRPVDWVYVDDVVEALLVSAEAQSAVGETIDVGSGILTPVRAVVEEIVRVMRPSSEPRFGSVPERPNERIRVADAERTRALLGWAPDTSLERGLAATVDWYATRKAA